MLILLLAALGVMALMALTILHASVWISLLSLLCVLGGIALWILRNKLPKMAVTGGGIACAVVAAVLLIPAGNHADDFSGYTSIAEDAEQALVNGKYEQAQLLINRIEEVYGEDDNTIYMTVVRMVAQRDYAGAYDKIEHMKDKTSKLYYAMKEHIYQQDPSEGTVEGLCAVYLAAAKEYPDWTYMQQKAGISQIQMKNYESAVYFLERSLLQDTENAVTYYYLGMAHYYLSEYEVSMNCFEAALERDLHEDYTKDLLWYVNQMEQEG